MEPVDRSTIWPYDEHGEPRDFYYARYAHPTEAPPPRRRLGELEGGDALLYPSGMGAETVVLLALARPGTHVALAEGAYYGTSVLLRELARWDITFVEFDQTGPAPDADIVWVESPANPLLTMPDWPSLRDHPGLPWSATRRSRRRSTSAPSTRAPDVVVHSATKYLTGHHNALLGATVTGDPELTLGLREIRTRAGITASPDAAFALLDGLDTLDARMRAITTSAAELARRLAGHPKVDHVRYPGFSGVISFDVDEARAVETATRLIVNATSLGGVTSTIESRYRWEGDRIPSGLLRLSVGLEDVDDLWADLEQALA